TLMAGPVDTRISPTKVNELATGRPLSWFRRHLIDTVPPPYRGAGRRVYPGFMQLLAFMSMNAQRHVKAHVQLFEHLVAGRTAEAEAIRTSTTSISRCWTCRPSSTLKPSSACSRRRISPAA